MRWFFRVPRGTIRRELPGKRPPSPFHVEHADSQANATAAIGFTKDPSRRTLYHVLILNESFDKIIQKSQVDRLDVIPADKNLAGAAVELVNAENREHKLQAALRA